jgi:zinc protease
VKVQAPLLAGLASLGGLLLLLDCGGQPPLPPPPPGPAPVASWPPVTAPPPPRVTPDAPFRDNPPQAGPAVVWSPPEVQAWSLSNGVRVLFVERHDLPIVSLRVVTAVGAGERDGARPGSTAFMGAMLEQGAGTLSALALSDEYEALGADHSAGCDWDSCVVRAKVLASRFDAALDRVADVALRPAFDPAEIERLRLRWLGNLTQEKNSPPAMEQNALAAAIFGRKHPYGHSLRGVPADIEKLTRGEIVDRYKSALSPGLTTIAVAGDVGRDDLKAKLEAHFGAWKGGAAPAVTPAHAPRPAKTAARILLVDVPGAAQSQVLVADEGAAFGEKDRIALGVMNAILGGMFSSRINLELRETRAYTYGAHSRFAMRHGAGPFSAGGAIFADHTADAVRVLLSEVDRIRSAPVSDVELADAKENARLALPARFESVDEVTGALQDLAVYRLPLDEYATRSARIDAVTAADVQRVAQKWLRPEGLRVVVAGDRAKIEKGLAALEIGGGAIDRRDPYGDPVSDRVSDRISDRIK